MSVRCIPTWSNARASSNVDCFDVIDVALPVLPYGSMSDMQNPRDGSKSYPRTSSRYRNRYSMKTALVSFARSFLASYSRSQVGRRANSTYSE